MLYHMLVRDIKYTYNREYSKSLDIADMIKSNIFTGISGVTRLKIKL